MWGRRVLGLILVSPTRLGQAQQAELHKAATKIQARPPTPRRSGPPARAPLPVRLFYKFEPRASITSACLTRLASSAPSTPRCLVSLLGGDESPIRRARLARAPRAARPTMR